MSDDEAISIFGDWYGPTRTICAVLGEMRKCYKTRNFAYLPGLIEECQSMGNRMEAALGDQSNFVEITEKLSEAKETLKQLKEEYVMLKEKRDELQAADD